MTHRFSLTLANLNLSFLGLNAKEPNLPQYNIAPRSQVRIIRQNDDGTNELVNVSWGLVPAWLKNLSHAQHLARAESIQQKPMFKQAFAKRRCLILADGYYEWRQASAEKKQPYHITLKNHGLFAFAGVWERYPVDQHLAYDSCALITTPANSELSTFNERMPLILAPEDYAAWLNPGSPGDHYHPLVRPLQEGILRAQRISTFVNDPAHQSPECCRPLA